MAMALLKAVILLIYLWNVILHLLHSRLTFPNSRHCPQSFNGGTRNLVPILSTSYEPRKTHSARSYRGNMRLSPCIIYIPSEVLGNRAVFGVSWGFTGLAGAIVADLAFWMWCLIYVVIIHLVFDRLDVWAILRILHLVSTSSILEFSCWYRLYRGGILYPCINLFTGKPLGNRAVFGVSWVFAGSAGWIAAGITHPMGLFVHLMVR